MRRARTLLGAALLAGATLVLLAPLSADAAALTQAGWWWRVNDGNLPTALPGPPGSPPGSLVVAGAPDGATAIAALHFDVPDGEGNPVLTLLVAENGDQGGEAAILAACVTGTAWQPASGGRWSDKPFPACAEGAVNGLRADDGTSWTFALAPLLSDEILDITLVPGVDPALPEGANGSVFQITFEAPTTASLSTAGDAGGGADLPVPDFGAPSGSPADLGSFDNPAIGGDLALPPMGGTPGFTPSLPDSEQGLTATAPLAQGRNAPLQAVPVATVRDHGALAFAILLLCGGVTLWSAQLPVPGPRRLGPFGSADPPDSPEPAAAETAGLGRFARVRAGAPPRL